MNTQAKIRIAHTLTKDPVQAASELYHGVMQANIALLIFFCSNEYDRDLLALALQRRFSDIHVVGCTTAGEIGPLGICEHSLVGISFSADTCVAVTGILKDLQQFDKTKGYTFAQELLQRLENQVLPSYKNTFGLLLIDGLSGREELVTQILQNVLGNVSLIGGSAGDGLNFQSTYIYFAGRFHADSAILILLTTKLPFTVFKTQHFVPTKEWMVVTEADEPQRMVKEINGLPAALEYARFIGVDVCELNPSLFAAFPVMVFINSNYYVRSIRCANADNSLTFYCAIEEGLVLHLGTGVDLVDNLESAYTKARLQIGQPQLVLGCDCILRKLEVVEKDLLKQVENIFLSNHTAGFSTYGEQFCGVHVNQTFAAIAIGNATEETGNGHTH